MTAEPDGYRRSSSPRSSAGAPRRDAGAPAAARLAARQDPRPRRPAARRRRLRQDHAPRRLLAADPAADALVSARRRRSRLDRRSCATSSRRGGSTTRTSRRRRRRCCARSAYRSGAARPCSTPSCASCRASPGEGAALILDDFHLVDDAADVRHITRELLARGAGATVLRLRQPSSAGRSRSRGCGPSARSPSSTPMTCASMPTRPRSCSARRTAGTSSPTSWPTSPHRTEGWIASLQLVHAALRDRSPAEIRRFVRTLTGADHDSTTTSPRRSSATCQRSCSGS